MRAQVAALLLCAHTVPGEVVELKMSTFESSVFGAGRTAAFVNFGAPWCEHCKLLEADWEDLGEEHERDAALLTGTVDCSAAASKYLCSNNSISILPTLVYFLPPDREPEVYDGERTGRELGAFTRSLRCQETKLKRCTAGQRKLLLEFGGMSDEAVRTELVSIRKEVQTAKAQEDQLVSKYDPKDQKMVEDAGVLNEMDVAVRRVKALAEQYGPRVLMMKKWLSASEKTKRQRNRRTASTKDEV